mmetsp:Transcript_80315/g.259536  ORF Transcript_80315/g.259536 Transcript_80315/m.259536 type:complete len:305 (-) Transcript_80315:291-1205(-)
MPVASLRATGATRGTIGTTHGAASSAAWSRQFACCPRRRSWPRPLTPAPPLSCARSCRRPGAPLLPEGIRALAFVGALKALAPVLGGLARGGIGLQDCFQVLDNASLVFMEYIDYAVLLGEEDLRFGSQRVSRAVFHGDASNAGYSEALLHRSHVLGWLLEGGELGLSGAHRMEAPVMLEVGVNVGQLATALLRSHSRLRWFGVDPYLGDIWTPGGTSFPARDVLKLAKEHLAPFDGRARLFVAPSLALDPHNVGVGPAPLDMLFVDGLHDEASCGPRTHRCRSRRPCTWPQTASSGGGLEGWS